MEKVAVLPRPAPITFNDMYHLSLRGRINGNGICPFISYHQGHPTAPVSRRHLAATGEPVDPAHSGVRFANGVRSVASVAGSAEL
jgi:hypothetical protein